ncbi:phosphonate C-P lyase system protein PhnH [Pseudorhizobium endolithicum]|uniref:Phosphonate C-P lyase system protein PhnH n=1 Tax=Pseudorhizobium endolithicum TaxID=1191678 RepID=A0ABN7JHB9_9HYPH|nr:phosphonate C-P lyase system protein PhnH [Pseudorhizobium endolithicum]CAD7029834.1 phosphonate C-P lyase system protein PhnH [Pseudorhizobium endolithicum]
MNTNLQALSGGFAQPVLNAQAVFRLLMDGMSRPGTIQTTAVETGQPAPLGQAAAAVALTLCDADTPVWLQSSLAKSAVGEWIAFHTGAAMVQEKAEAKFAFLQASAGVCSFDLFASGTQEYPDRSATVVIEVSAFGEGRSFTLAGPGIRDQSKVSIAGLPAMFDEIWRNNRTLFPRGVDVILTAGASLLCLPRTTKIA